jgi:glycosidase
MKRIMLLIALSLFTVTLSACNNKTESIDFDEIYPNHGNYYQLFVRSFADSDGDGVGDFNGITAKLDYLVDLGIDALWLMPIHPSPTYHGYDVTDYYDVNPEYGTMEDFENLLEEADKVGINIIIDFVLNHTSEQHPWFQAWKNGDPDYAGYYRLIDAADERRDINSSLWHATEGGYYAGVFGGWMPDLNWSNPAVQTEMINAATFWLEKGVDGFRLDAALHIETLGEAAAPTVPIDSTLTKLEYWEYMIKLEYPDAYVVGEIWSDFSQFNQFLVAMDSALNFETGDLITGAINRSFDSEYLEIIIRQEARIKGMNEEGINAPFLRNHDQDRLASEFGGNKSKLTLAAEMLLTLPGNPYLYYGEEIGMFGVKTQGPTIWDETRRLPLLFGDEYQTSWFVDTEFNTNVDDIPTQLEDEDSLLNTYRTLLRLRQDSLALRYGTISAYENADSALIGYYRVFNYDENNQDIVLVLHNIATSDYQVYLEDDYDVLYYSEGNENFTNIVAARSTVILQIPVEMMSEIS